MTSGYKIDGNDLLSTYNITVKRVTGLLQFLARKGEVSQSWPDSDGEENFTDSTDIWFEGRDIIMSCYIRAATWSTFEVKLRTFKAILEKTGLRTLAVPYSTDTWSLMYVKGSDVDILTPKRHTSVIVGEFWVQFREVTPARG